MNTNNPVANPDFATTIGAPGSPTAITVNIKGNDGPGNPGGTLGTPTISTPPAHGSASIDGNGNLVYTPTAGYYGTDVVTYQICETPSTPSCATATVTITVKAPGSPAAVSANDDYVSTLGGLPVSGNVLTNDLGTGLSVSNAGTIVTSSGTLVLTSSGSYTFTPAAGVTGPVDFTYTACDNNTPSTCGTATLHVLVNQGPDLTPTIYMPQANFAVAPNNVRDFVVNVEELVGQPTSRGNVAITITVPTGYTVSFSTAITSINVTDGTSNPVAVDNTKWTITGGNNQQISLLINADQFIAAKTTARLGFTATRTNANSGSVSNITVNVTNDATHTYDGNPLNNVYARIISGL
ncbi:hypothetical protein GO730_27765 [Spirosoma sp. HMF3257]|uniref:Ig-like domain-containing protein n=1 Tax=Spirosoma telluris TaxID=2183553 RepID=UPI0011B93B05|nr:hypothetical protein [Spirosoma telluris]